MIKSGNFDSKQMYDKYDHGNDDDVNNTDDDYHVSSRCLHVNIKIWTTKYVNNIHYRKLQEETSYR